MRSITVVGASPAGLSTVRALRAEGYDGEIVVVGKERHARTPVAVLSLDQPEFFNRRRRTLVPAAAVAAAVP